MKEIRYCDHCDKDTEHTIKLERDANYPTKSFVKAEQEGYASIQDCIFYSNGDSEWRITCTVCGISYEKI